MIYFSLRQSFVGNILFLGDHDWPKGMHVTIQEMNRTGSLCKFTFTHSLQCLIFFLVYLMLCIHVSKG